MTWFKAALLASGVLLISGAISFGVFSWLQGGSAGAQDQGSDATNGVRDWRVSSVTDAEALTGYPVAEPGFLPSGFERGTIDVSQPPFENLPKYVRQVWIWAEDRTIGIILVQDPSLRGMGNSEPAEIAGVQGERSLQPANPPSLAHPLLSLFWRDGEFGYQLTGTLAGPITEDVLLEVAVSIQPRR